MNVETHGLAGAYAVDALDDAERAAFEAHLHECADCLEELATLGAAAAELGAVTATAPPPAAKDAVMARIRAVRPLAPEAEADEDREAVEDHDAEAVEDRHAQATAAGAEGAGSAGSADVPSLAERRRRLGGRWAWAVAAAAAAAVVIGGLAWSPWSDSTPPPTTTVAERVLSADDATRVEKQIGDATAVVVVSRSVGRAVIETTDMPPPPSGKDYELWLQRPDGTMQPAGLMPRDGTTSRAVALKGDASTAVGVGITVEPAGGSSEPTGSPIALFPLRT